MLPDIDHPNRQFAVSGLGAAAGGGVLTRSFEDLHPRHDAYETVWNGTMAAQAQKLEQRQPPPPRLTDAQIADRRYRIFTKLRNVIAENGRPVTVAEAARLSGFTRDITDLALRRMALSGQLSTFVQLNSERTSARRTWLRVYALPLTQEDAA